MMTLYWISVLQLLTLTTLTDYTTTTVDAWVILPTTVIIHHRQHQQKLSQKQSQFQILLSKNSPTTSGKCHVQQQQQQRTSSSPSSPLLHMAGFGTDSSTTDSKEIKLKPKQQWDRYTALKKEPSHVVGVKVISTTTTKEGGNDDDDKNDWLVVGAVKSESSITTEIAVARQRALLVEHAKRLYPLQISPKVQIEWGYVVKDDDEDDVVVDSDTTTNTTEETNNGNNNNRNWVTVDKTVLDTITTAKGIEKQMGFVGTPDPNTGFYCVYNEGRLVKSTDSNAAATRPTTSKKLE